MTDRIAFGVTDEFSRLAHVIMGTGEGFHRDPSKVEMVNATQSATVDASGHPDPVQLAREFAAFEVAMTAEGVTVHRPRLAPDSVQDQTCPRDIGFVIGDIFVQAGMRNTSRVEEIDGIRHILSNCDGPILTIPDGVALEGGDVIVDGGRIFVGVGQRSDAEGADWLRARFGSDHTVIVLPTHADDILHLDCTFNPLGLGHALIYPDGLVEIPDQIREGVHWIEVTKSEMQALATNVFSVSPDTIIARDAPDCARVNAELRRVGYRVIEVTFDAVPSIGGSFRCATLPLRRR